MSAQKSFLIEVDYDQPIPDLVVRGMYGRKNISHDRVPRSSRSGKREIEIALLHLGEPMVYPGVIGDFLASGYRPVEPREILAFGIQHPKEQYGFPIHALGDPYRLREDGGEFNVFLWISTDDGRQFRSVGERPIDLVYDEDCRFLAVPIEE